MKTGMQLLEKEMVKENLVIDGTHCPIYGLGNGIMCEEHLLSTKNFSWLRNYINNLDKFDQNTLYIIDSAITDRKSQIINDIEIVDGKMDLQGYLEKSTCSTYMEKIIKEIINLEKAREIIFGEVQKDGS